jgi:hypothetical protein
MTTDRIHILKHEAVPGCGSFEVRFPDDRQKHEHEVRLGRITAMPGGVSPFQRGPASR